VAGVGLPSVSGRCPTPHEHEKGEHQQQQQQQQQHHQRQQRRQRQCQCGAVAVAPHGCGPSGADVGSRGADVSSPAREPVRPQSSPSIASSLGTASTPAPEFQILQLPGEIWLEFQPPARVHGPIRVQRGPWGHVAAPQACARALSAAFSELKTTSPAHTGGGCPTPSPVSLKEGGTVTHVTILRGHQLQLTYEIQARYSPKVWTGAREYPLTGK